MIAPEAPVRTTHFPQPLVPEPPPVSAASATRYRISACIGQHIGDRGEQQDRAGLFTSKRSAGCVLAIVADGMGGRTGGSLAAEQVIATARALFEEFNPSTQSVTDLLAEIIRDAHTIIQLTAVTAEKEPHSTIVAMVLQPGVANWAHVGDSRLYFFKGEQLEFRTTDHSYVEHLIRSGKLAREASAGHKMGHVLTSALGTDRPPVVDFGEARDLSPNDSFLLCSDGLWHYFTDQELGQAIAYSPTRKASEALIENARYRARGKGDNCTFGLVKLMDPGSETVIG
ncbi:Stp1/IreP family PP2C-type Ser/Thr phosphatase [soil metagenome]